MSSSIERCIKYEKRGFKLTNMNETAKTIYKLITDEELKKKYTGILEILELRKNQSEYEYTYWHIFPEMTKYELNSYDLGIDCGHRVYHTRLVDNTKNIHGIDTWTQKEKIYIYT